MSDHKRPCKDFIDASLADKLRRYRQADPNFERAIREFAEAEAKYGKDDPAEGKIVIAPKTPDGPK